MSEEELAEQAKIEKILIELNKTGLSYLKHRISSSRQFSIKKQ